MEYLCIGKIVNTHGIKGELRILSDFQYKDKVFVKKFPIYIGKSKVKEIIASYRYHKIFDMIMMEGYTNINEVLKYKGKFVYIKKEDLHLKKDEYLDEDLIHLKVIVNHQVVGYVVRIEKGVQNQIIVNKDGINYRIPYVHDIIKDINLEEGTITIEYIKGLLD